MVRKGHGWFVGAFDLGAHWRSYLADFDARRHRDEAVVRVTPRLLGQLPDLLEPVVARAALDSAGPPGADGRVEVVVPVESVEHAVGVLLRLGAEAEVMAPVGLRARMAEVVAALAETYGVPCEPLTRVGGGVVHKPAVVPRN
ncbi:WYL domain-containing protein [Streptomyces sp. NPDC003717]|uniref:WYL domain-containing protein n=1 Tax=Streptomyces sp. NPDC003717 TaxID=3154276 RepID=UPI0033ACD911